MKERKHGLMGEHLENLDTPLVKRYAKLSDVPKEPARDYELRYEIEARKYHYLNTNPTRVESWSADIVRAHLTLSDSEESSSSDYSFSFSQSSSSSSYSPSSAKLPTINVSSPIRYPTQSRRQPLYATTRHR